MKRTILYLAACVLAVGFAAGAHAQDTTLTCEDYRCMFQQRLTEECQCTTARNHGQYVSCVAHIIKDLTDTQGMPVNCKGKLQRCAARSVCGKQTHGFHTCTTIVYGTCAPDAVTQALVCSNNPLLACATNTDCGVVSESCKITRHPETCVGDGVSLDLSPTCCSQCSAPPTTVPVP